MPSSVELTTEQRILEAAVLLPDGGAVTGWAGLSWGGAGRWFNGRGPDGRTPLNVWLVSAAHDIRRQPGIAVSSERLAPRDVKTLDGIPVTSHVRSVCFEMRYTSSMRRGVVAASMAAYFDLTSVDELTAYVETHPGWTGIPQCRAGVPFVEENCWSPTEVEMVLVWRLDADLPRPMCNRPVFDRSGNHVGTPDLLDVEAGVVGQYEGVVHLDSDRRGRDIGSEQRYRRVGLEYFTMIRSDRPDTGPVVDRMLSARRRAAFASETTRPWTVEPPPWWVPTHTVEMRRRLTQDQRRRLLRYRAA